MTHLRFRRTTTCFPRFAFLFRSRYDQPVYAHRCYYQHRQEIFRREPNCKILRGDIFFPFLVSSSPRKLPPSSLRAGRGRCRFYFSCPVSFATFLSPGDAGKKLPNAAGATLEREVRKGRESLARNHLRRGKCIVNQRLFSPSRPGERNEELASSLRSARRGR